jgi:DNA polymerase
MTPEEKKEALQDLYQDWVECERCALCNPRARRRINVVFGEGNPDARVLIVGEPPGRDEDASGSPYQGRDAEVVDDFLANNASTRNDVFITSIVGCRPTDDEDPTRNRTPVKAEIAACLPRVHRIIEIIDPDVVLLLGNTALKALTKEKRNVTKLSTSPHLYNVVEVVTPGQQIPVSRAGICTFAPSYLRMKWSLEEGSDVHKAFLMWKKAFSVADMFGQIYRGVVTPDRSSD